MQPLLIALRHSSATVHVSRHCILRNLCFSSPPLKRPRAPRPWTSEEDAQLVAAVRTATSNVNGTESISWAKVSKALAARDKTACRQRWIMSLDENRSVGRWSAVELRNLYELEKKVGPNYALIAALLPTRRNHMQVRERLLEGSRSGQRWGAEEDELLLKAVEKYGRSWASVARDVPGRTVGQCLERWSLSLDPRLRKGRWTKEEDRKLLDVVNMFIESGKPFHFGDVARRLGGTRNRKVCRGRWIRLQKGKEAADGYEGKNET